MYLFFLANVFEKPVRDIASAKYKSKLSFEGIIKSMHVWHFGTVLYQVVFYLDVDNDMIGFEQPSVRYEIYDMIAARALRKARYLAHFLIPYHEIEKIYLNEKEVRERVKRGY